jgi:hypothetical protein
MAASAIVFGLLTAVFGLVGPEQEVHAFHNAVVASLLLALSAPPAVAAARAAPSPFANPLAEDYDDYARAFQLPGREPERRRPDRAERPDRSERSDEVRQARRRDPEPDDRRRSVDDDLRRRAEEEEKYRQRGFRPRRRDPDWDD